MKVEPGEELHEELCYIPEYEGDSNKGKAIKVLRHVFVAGDPSMSRRPCFEVELPNGKSKFYLDPRVGTYEDREGRKCRIVHKS